MEYLVTGLEINIRIVPFSISLEMREEALKAERSAGASPHIQTWEKTTKNPLRNSALIAKERPRKFGMDLEIKAKRKIGRRTRKE